MTSDKITPSHYSPRIRSGGLDQHSGAILEHLFVLGAPVRLLLSYGCSKRVGGRLMLNFDGKSIRPLRNNRILPADQEFDPIDLDLILNFDRTIIATDDVAKLVGWVALNLLTQFLIRMSSYLSPTTICNRTKPSND